MNFVSTKLPSFPHFEAWFEWVAFSLGLVFS